MPETTAAVDRAAADIRLTRPAREVLERAVELAAARNERDATPVDVLRALLATPGSLAGSAMRGLGTDPATVAASLPAGGDGSVLSLRQLLVNANREAQVLGHYQVDPVHLLLALLYTDARTTSAILQSAGLTLYDVRRHVQMGTAREDAAPAATRGSRAPDRALRRRPWPTLRGAAGVSPIFFGLVVGSVVSGLLLWFGVLPAATGVFTIVFVVFGWVVSVCVHEFFHAVVAYVGGDRDVAASGYLTLNPLRYTSVVMSIVFPVIALLLGGLGLPGGAVYINHARLRSKAWDSAVSIAGPVANVAFALLIAAVISVAVRLGWLTFGNLAFFEALAFLGYIEVIAIVLNLLPIPPLDGFGILRPWLPYSIQAAASNIGTAGYVVVFLLLWYVPPVASAVFGAASTLTGVLGIDPSLVSLGFEHMRFR